MENDFQEMIEKAITVRKKYAEKDKKQWKIEQDFMGMVKDLGELSELLMIYEGYRGVKNKEIKEKIGHELADLLYSIFVIAKNTEVDLEKSFWRTMEELDKRLED